MKPPTPFHPPRSPQGAVLIIVLSCLVLVTVLALTLLKRVEVDRANSSGFRGGVQSRGLAEYAVNTVIAQISTATTQGANAGWSSQPGMIRTFSSGGTNAHKLYSAPTLTQSNLAPGAFTTMDAPPAAWSNSPALWTDLNAPVVAGSGTNFPILDASALGRVEGFTITGAPGATAAQPAPMPVQWLYVLEDGTLAPASVAGAAVTVSGATTNNPIVGRIAFWTDDESAKINVNTASEGTFWDTTRVWNTNETDLARFQPAQGEFQRYPGHPAMVSLAPVFFAASSNSTPALSTAQRNAIYDIVPRINGGGSQAGTVRATGVINPDAHRLYANIDELIFSTSRTNQNAAAGIDRTKLERARFFLTANSRAPEITLFNTPRVATWPVFFNHTTNSNRVTAYDRLLDFCATTAPDSISAPDSIYYFQRQNSKSPVNDWNNIERNRELLRYLQALSGKNIPGFGASMEGKLGSADRDQLLVQMFDYIRSSNLYDDNLSPVTYADQAAADNAVQFTGGRTNNTFRVARGHGFVAPIRVPQGLTGTAPAPGTETAANRPHMGFGRFHTIAEAGLLFICNADGRNGTFTNAVNDVGVSLTNTNSPPPTPQELARLMSNVAPGTATTDRTFNYTFNYSNPTNPTVVSSAGTVFPENRMLAQTLATNQRRLQMMLFFDLFSPMQGWTQYAIDGSFDVEVTGIFTVGGQSVTFASAAETVNFTSSGIFGYHPYGGHIGFRNALTISGFDKGNPIATKRSPFLDTGLDSTNRYGLISDPFTVTVPGNGLMSFQAPLITVKFYSRQRDMGRSVARSPSDLVQTIELQFPPAPFPIPRLIATGTPKNGEGENLATTPDYWWSLARSPAFASPPAAIPQPANPMIGGRLNGISGRPHETHGNFIRRGDTLKTLVPYHADTRLVAGSSFVPAGVFQPSTFYFSPDTNNSVSSYLTDGDRSNSADDMPFAGNNDNRGVWFRPGAVNSPAGITTAARLVPDADYHQGRFPKFSGIAITDANRISGRPFQQFGDFDQGIGAVYDGAYVNKPDEGTTTTSSAVVPYFDNRWEQYASGPTYFSPNRQIPGPGMLGSLPTKLWTANAALNPAAPTANANNTWRTLLFRPQAGHPGEANPPDHLWMDLFWMPVVEPYAISEPFSTAGKINMNYAIAPFSYIRRATGMVALLRNEQITAIPTSNANNYKTGAGGAVFRRAIDIHTTLQTLDTKFNNGEIYKSATEICDIPLRAIGTTVNYATTHSLTGDNTRERPYVNLQTRLTTKSNVYTVHYRVEVLKKRGGSTPDQWTEGQDQVVSTLRGSTLIERFLDPNTPVPDYAGDFAASAGATPTDLGNYYRWRVLAERQFAP